MKKQVSGLISESGMPANLSETESMALDPELATEFRKVISRAPP